MKKNKYLVGIILTVSLLIVQVGSVLAAPTAQAFPPVTGTVQSITLETDPNSGVITVLVTVIFEDQTTQEVRVSQQSAEKLGLVVFDADGKSVINHSALAQPVEIKLTMVIPDQEEGRHPVANALEAFFSDIEGLDYGMIMDAHQRGVGFGVIAQALWMTRQIGGSSDDFHSFIDAKQTGDYSGFKGYALEDGSAPMNWGQLRKAILHTDKRLNSDATLSNQNGNGNQNHNDQGKDKSKENDKGNGKEKSNNGKGNDNKP